MMATLRWARFIKQMTQKELELRSEVHQTKISHFENGNLLPRDDERERIAKALDVKPDELEFFLKTDEQS